MNTVIDRRLALRLGGVMLVIVLVIAVPVVIAKRSSISGNPASKVAPLASPDASPALTPAPARGTPEAGSVAGCPLGQLVRDAGQLKEAMAAARPGTVIVMASATYSDHFEATMSGTADAPITLCGARDAVIDGGDVKMGYSLYLKGVDWWRVIGFTIRGAQKGLVTDHTHHALIQHLFVHDTGDEAIHLRESSTDNTVDSNTVRNTGLLNSKFGEGIYVGSARSNWCRYTSCNPDNSDRNVISNNDISNTTAENIDIKEGTTGGVIEHNRLFGDGMVASAASAWVNVKGNEWTITGNTGQHSPKDGFQVHRVASGWGERNVFRSNHAEVDGPGYGFYVQSASLATTVACDNTAVGAGRGLTNVRCQ